MELSWPISAAEVERVNALMDYEFGEKGWLIGIHTASATDPGSGGTVSATVLEVEMRNHRRAFIVLRRGLDILEMFLPPIEECRCPHDALAYMLLMEQEDLVSTW